MSAASTNATEVSGRLQRITDELRETHELLLSGADLDARLLTDFRDAMNRVRNTAWAMQQYGESKATEKDPSAVLSVVAGERIRAGYQLAKLIRADLDNTEIRFQKGQLLELHEATRELFRELDRMVGAIA